MFYGRSDRGQAVNSDFLARWTQDDASRRGELGRLISSYAGRFPAGFEATFDELAAGQDHALMVCLLSALAGFRNEAGEIVPLSRGAIRGAVNLLTAAGEEVANTHTRKQLLTDILYLRP